VRLPDGYTSRSMTADDLDAAVEVFASYDEALTGQIDPRREFLWEVWSLPYVDLRLDTRLVEQGDTPVAVVQTVGDPDAGGYQFGLGRVVPQHQRRGIGSALLTWTEERARERRRPGEAPIRPRTSILGIDAPAASLLEHRGYHLVRTGVDMGMPLLGDERATEPPTGVDLLGFVTGRDERTVFELHRETFADHWGQFPGTIEAFAQEWWDAPTWDPGLVVIARHAHEPVGVVASIIVSSGGYVTTLGVRESWRGRGIATALMHRTIADLAVRGCRDVFLSADSANLTGATTLYANLGMTVRRETHVYDGPAEMESPPGSRSLR
jgi:mycothiol synthase